MLVRRTLQLIVVVLAVGMQLVTAQTDSTPPAKKPPASPKAAAAAPVQPRPSAPQVVTVVHRLNGLKVFRLILRSQDQLQAVAGLDEASTLMDDVHTNVIAGLAMDDGQTVAAWLPEADLEFGSMPPLM